jgi:hypothetical protein
MCELITWGSGTQQVNTTLLDPMYTDCSTKIGQNCKLHEAVCMRSSVIPDVSNI